VTGRSSKGRSRGVPGYPVRMPVVDIVEIAIGGGSIGWVDEGGRLRVGPQSAGADPAPACYGRGGMEPTLTDANLIGNRIRADYFASGRMRLDVERARSALNRLGERLGLPAEAVAMAMLRVSDAAVIDALKLVSVQRGHDPRDFVLIASGGGGPLNAARLGQELGVREIIIPRHPGYVSAFGMLVTQPKRDFSRTLTRSFGALAPSFLTEIFAELEEEARAYFGDLGAGTGLMFDHLVDLRYVGQQHSITLHLDLGLDDPTSLAERFSEAHELAYKFRLDDHRIEMVAYRLSASAQMTLPQLQAPPQRARSLEAALQGERLVDFGDAAPQKVRVFNRDILPVGLELSGPALVEESSSTTAVLPGQRLFIDELGLLHIVPAETGARA
jgi:N-methylhydantoinase A